jgi:hypothetical protein
VKVENFLATKINSKRLQCTDKDERINLTTPGRREILNKIAG